MIHADITDVVPDLVDQLDHRRRSGERRRRSQAEDAGVRRLPTGRQPTGRGR